jgi:hypothetical protein
MERRIVPRRRIGLEEISDWARQVGFEADSRSFETAEHEDSPEYRWHVGNGNDIQLVKSASLGRDYFVISAERPDPIIELVTSRFSCYGFQEILDRLTSADSVDSKRDALFLVAAAAPTLCIETVYRNIEHALQDDDPLVRSAAITTAFHLEWRQLAPLLRVCSEADESEEVRALAGYLAGLSRWSRG